MQLNVARLLDGANVAEDGIVKVLIRGALLLAVMYQIGNVEQRCIDRVPAGSVVVGGIWI